MPVGWGSGFEDGGCLCGWYQREIDRLRWKCGELQRRVDLLEKGEWGSEMLEVGSCPQCGGPLWSPRRWEGPGVPPVRCGCERGGGE